MINYLYAISVFAIKQIYFSDSYRCMENSDILKSGTIACELCIHKHYTKLKIIAKNLHMYHYILVNKT
jgi:hypothetical protein